MPAFLAGHSILSKGLNPQWGLHRLRSVGCWPPRSCVVCSALQVAALLAGNPILIEGFTAFLPDKTAFLQLDDRSGGPAHPLKGFQKWVSPFLV